MWMHAQSRASISQDNWGDIKKTGGLGDEVLQKLKIFCETTHNICIKIRQTTVFAVTGKLNPQISWGGGDITMYVPPFINIEGDMSPLSHRYRRPCAQYTETRINITCCPLSGRLPAVSLLWAGWKPGLTYKLDVIVNRGFFFVPGKLQPI